MCFDLKVDVTAMVVSHNRAYCPTKRNSRHASFLCRHVETNDDTCWLC